MESKILKLAEKVKSNDLVSINEDLCVVERVPITVEGRSPLSWCSYDQNGGKSLPSKKFIALVVPPQVSTLKCLPFWGPIRRHRGLPQYADISDLMEGTEGALNPTYSGIVYDFKNLRFKERSLINKLKPIKDVSCGIVLFEATLMDNDGTRVILNYCVKFQIKSNNGYAAKKRRLQDINLGIVTTPVQNPFSTQIPHLSPIVSQNSPDSVSNPLTAIVQSFSYSIENVLNDEEPQTTLNNSGSLIPISPITPISGSPRELGHSNEISRDYIINSI